MLKWSVITLVAVVALGYLLKEHEVATRQLKQQLDQQSAQQKAREKRKQQRFIPSIAPSPLNVVPSVKDSIEKVSSSVKQKILLENLTCASKKQCVLVDITFADISCAFAINIIGASLLAKAEDDFSAVGKCPSYPENSQLSCQSNLCSYGSINN